MKNKFTLLTVIISFITTPLYAQKPFVYLLLGGLALTNGVYLSDKSEDLYAKSHDYQILAVDAQNKSLESARLYGEYNAFMEIAKLLNDVYLLQEATVEAQRYWQESIMYQNQSQDFFAQSKHKDKRSTRYEWGANASFAAGGILLIKGVWDLIQEEQSYYTQKPAKKSNASWTVHAQFLPGKSQLSVSRKF